MLRTLIQYCSTSPISYFFFFFNDTATTEIYTLSLHDALPISFPAPAGTVELAQDWAALTAAAVQDEMYGPPPSTPDRKSTRLNSSHSQISYAVFCLKKKKNCLASDRRRLISTIRSRI